MLYDISSVATQGRANSNQWVSAYTLVYYSNSQGGQVHFMNPIDDDHDFAGNTDANSVVEYDLRAAAASTVYVQLSTQSCHEWCALRWEVYGTRS